MSGFTCLDGRECSPGCTGGRRRRRPGDLRPDRRKLSNSLPCWQSAHRCQSSSATAPTLRGKPRTGDTTMGTGPVPVGRGMGHRLVLLSVRARMNCLVWWTVLVRPRGQHLGRGDVGRMAAGVPPIAASHQARSAGWCSGNPGWWRGGQRRRSISGIGMARAKVVRHLRRHECHRGGAGDSCGGGQRAKQAESEAPQPAWHVGGRAGSDSLSVNPRVPCAGATGKEGGSIAVNDRRPVDHLVLVLAGERLAAI